MQPTIKEAVEWVLAGDWNLGDLATYVRAEHVFQFDQLVELFSALCDQSHLAGYEDGRGDGYHDGYGDGREAGYHDGYGDGREEGYQAGYEEGEDRGYDIGLQDGRNGV